MKKLDGECLTLRFYFGLSREAAGALGGLSGDSDPSLKLLLAFCRRAHEDPELFSRFKCLGALRNPAEVGKGLWPASIPGVLS